MKYITSPSIITAMVLAVAAFCHVVSAEQIENELQTEPPTLPIIEVTLPAGVTTTDEDIADVIDSLIRTTGDNETEAPVTTSPPTEMPFTTEPYLSLKETMFRQEFLVGKEFTDREIKAFEELHQQYTVYFSPLSPAEVEQTITTICTVHRQSLEGERMLRGSGRSLTTETERLSVDFVMTYESTRYNVTEYPKLFQEWSAENLDVMLDQMRFLKIDVTGVEVPKRIVISKPTESPRETLSTIASTTDNTTIVVVQQTKWSVAAIVVFSIALLLAISTMVVGIHVFLNKHPLTCLDDDRIDTNADIEKHPKSPHTHCDETSCMDSVGMDSHASQLLSHYH